MNNDPRLVIAKLLKNWGADVYLQRRIYDTGSGLYGLDRLNLATPNVPNEYANASDESYFSRKLERWTCRYTFAGRKNQLTDVEMGRPEGLSHSVPLIVYFTWDCKPKEGDRVYIHDERFGGNMTTWLIRYAEAVIGWHGEITFYSCGLFREREPLPLSGE